MIHNVRPITAAQTRQLRHAVLKPFQPVEELIYPGDDAPDSLHVGAFQADQIVGIASVSRQPPPDRDDGDTWQLRGMAPTPEVRRQGYGAALIAACIEHVARHGGSAIWCNARVSAIPFYQSLGFAITSDVFEIPQTGPHVVMWRTI